MVKMDTVVSSSQNDQNKTSIQDINIMDGNTPWNTADQTLTTNSQTLVYIAVEYVKDFKLTNTTSNLTNQADLCSDYEHQVSNLDPNMSSVARYSPVYTEASTDFSPVVIHQLVTPEEHIQNQQFVNLGPALENMPTVLCSNDMHQVNNQYLHLVDQRQQCSPIVTNDANGKDLHLVPEREQEVLLITDETTGISYSVNTQELLVERCLEDDQQLLDALAPDPISESDLLTLDDSTLKSELNDDIDLPVNISSITTVETVGSSYENSFTTNGNSEQLHVMSSCSIETRKKKSDVFAEDDLLPCVYSIADKPILSRARASLPESHLQFGKVDEESAVFARKPIPLRTQFGPLEGVLLHEAKEKKCELTNSLLFYVESEETTCILDVSDENTSNWMSFVRKAQTFEEQNLLVTLENNAIYFTTTTNIMPKTELKVGYSVAYAQYFNLTALEPKSELCWPCYECSAKFTTSQELQNHLSKHDDIKDKNTKPKRSSKNKKILKYQTESIECNVCKEVFHQYNFLYLKTHIMQKHGICKESVEDYFSIIEHYKCESCTAEFRSEVLLKIHNLEHEPDSSDEQQNHVCPACQKKCPTQKQLVLHVVQHSLAAKLEHTERVKCPVCYKQFAYRDRLQRHMMVHGSEDSKPLQCKTCNKRFLNNSALACHIKTHYAGKKVFECPICKESFDHVLKLKLHVPKHCYNNVFTCPHCKKTFKKYSIIRKHIRAFHCERTHDCPHCVKVFPTLDKLKMHLLRHSDHREFLCADCGKQFKRKDKLKEHCKRLHYDERENTIPKQSTNKQKNRKFMPKVEPTDFHRFIYKCHACLVGFKRRGMLVNHLAKRHPDIRPDSVPELNLPILQTTRDYYCQYCDKVYKSSSKRKTHILKNHPGAALPMSNRKQGSLQEAPGMTNPTFSQTVGSITTSPQSCRWCHKQYASKAKLLQHQRKKHTDQVFNDLPKEKNDKPSNKLGDAPNNVVSAFEKVEVGEVVSSGLNKLHIDDGSQVCDMAVNENQNFMDPNELDNPNSHLYRLLTVNNGLLPPR